MNTPMKNKTYVILFLGLILPLITAACSIGAFLPDVSEEMPEALLATATSGEIDAQRIPVTNDEINEAAVSEVDTTSEAIVPVPAELDGEQSVLVELYARANPSVVNITIYGGQNGLVIPLGQGSGFVIDQDGHIVTNAHVVDSAEQVEVIFSDGTILSADIIGEDLNSDLAIVKVDQLPENVNPLPLGAMRELAVGQTVVAIGNPFGLEGTLTRGIISALGRNIPALTPFSIPQSIQTDAAINPGNSGGPLLNLDGEVIGVNAQIETSGTSRSNSGVGFAIPVSIVKLVVPDLKEHGGYKWSWLGVRGGNLTPAMVEAGELSVNKGAYISDVTPDGPAARAGLQGAADSVTVDGRIVPVGGDVIIAADDASIRSFDDLLIYIALKTRPGQEVTLTVLRAGEAQDIVVMLDERPESVASLTPEIPQLPE
jgi:S1-C subfamily serine protease